MKKKIYVLIGSLGLGGTEKQLLLKIKKLKKKFDFTVIIFHKRDHLYEKFKKENINLIDLTQAEKNFSLKYIIVFFKILNLLKKYPPIIFHFYLPHSYLLGGFLAYLFKNITFLMSRRSLNFYQRKIPFVKLIETKFLHRKMKYILVNSKAIKEQLIKEEKVEKSKIKVIYNSVELSKEKKKQNNKIVTILFLANLIPYKNHNMIIDAVKILPKKLNYIVKIVGDGNKNYINELTNKIKKNQLEKKFKFLGLVDNPNFLVKNSDVGILCSNEEGLSNSILEYMSNKLPVIATRVGGNCEMIKNNFNGFLIKKNDAKELALKLELLIKNKRLREKFGGNSLNLIKKNFCIEQNISRYEKLYESIIRLK